MQPVLFVQLEIFLFNPSAISDDIFASSTVSKLPDTGGNHHTDNGITEKTDAKSDGDIHVPETIHVHTEYVPSTSNGAFPTASKDTIANLLKVPKFFKEEKMASNKKSRLKNNNCSLSYFR